MQELVEILTKKNLTIGSVESFTVGNFAAQIGAIPGASKVLVGAMVTYQTKAKINCLQIDQKIIEKHGVVSEEIATLMASHGKKIIGSNICVSFTGNAGPSVMEGKPVGLVYISIKYLNYQITYSLQLQGNRQEIIQQAINDVKVKLLEIL